MDNPLTPAQISVVQRAVHDLMVEPTVKAILCGPLQSGGDHTHVMILLESIVVGVVLCCGNDKGNPEALAEGLYERVRQRIADNRLLNTPHAGRS